MVVKAELERLGLHYIMVELGEAEIMEDITKTQRKLLDSSLRKVGLEVMDDNRTILVEIALTPLCPYAIEPSYL